VGNASSESENRSLAWVSGGGGSAQAVLVLLFICGAVFVCGALFLVPIVLYGLSGGALGYLFSGGPARLGDLLQAGAAISIAYVACVSITPMPSWVRQVFAAVWVVALFGSALLVAGGSENPVPVVAVTDWTVVGLVGLLVGLPWILRRSHSRSPSSGA
jgi:hypothetical protein